MPIPKLVGAQRDFTAGELDQSTKRSPDELVKVGARQMSNWRILNSKAMQNRPGRSALFPAAGRVEEIIMPNGQVFYLAFNTGILLVYNAAGTPVFNASTFQLTPGGSTIPVPWVAGFPGGSLGGIVWVQIGNSIYITYPDGAPQNVPQILSFDGVSSWMLQPYAEARTPGGQKRTAFYRISPQGITLTPSFTIGNINITFSAPVLAAGMVGTRLEYCGRQLTITGVTNSQQGTATVNEALPPGQGLAYTSLTGTINIGDVVIGSITGAHGVVTQNAQEQVLTFSSIFTWPNVATIGQTVTQAATSSSGNVVSQSFSNYGGNFYTNLTVAVSAGAFTTGGAVVGPLGTATPTSVTALNTSLITVQIIPTGAGDSNAFVSFSGSETVAGPSGSFALSANSFVNPQPVTLWDDEVMNLFRGYPSSVFADQSRLGFANFPAVPSGIAWSAIGLYTDLYVGALPADAIFEIAPGNSQVLYVVPGMESAEFVFTDRAIFYIPIGGPQGQNPLEPGSVSFNKISDYGITPNVQPRRAEQSVVYVKAGGNAIGAVQVPGAYNRPYIVDHISELHTHLFENLNPIAIAIPPGPAQFAENYIYVLLQGGTLVVGRYSMRNGLIEPGSEGKPAIGWVPWNNGLSGSTWIAARQSNVILTTDYAAATIVERLDDTQYLDGAVFVNALPAALVPPGGKGPLYVWPGPNTSVFLIDQGTRFMSIYQVDANGFLIPQFIDGENLSSSALVAGLPWTATFEPWIPEAPPGESHKQRLLKRRISHMVVRFTNSTGFLMARLFAGELTPTSPPYGTVMNTHRVTTWDQDDDPSGPAPLRETAARWRPIGRAFDPRVAIIKDTPGPLTINELTLEVTI